MRDLLGDPAAHQLLRRACEAAYQVLVAIGLPEASLTFFFLFCCPGLSALVAPPSGSETRRCGGLPVILGVLISLTMPEPGLQILFQDRASEGLYAPDRTQTRQYFSDKRSQICIIRSDICKQT
jgi:hypothetical protein